MSTTDKTNESEMNSDFKAAAVAEGIQKGLANKILTNRTIVKSLIDEKTANLLDNLHLLLFVYVSIGFNEAGRAEISTTSDPNINNFICRPKARRTLRRQLKTL